MRRVLTSLGLAAALTTCAGPRPPDVILITVDTLRADRLGAWGHAAAVTPHIDGLAAAGRRFSQATTPFPRTTPAVASLFTGLWPQHHGSREIWQPLERGTTLAQILAGRGYATLGVTANPAAGRRQGLDRGFADFVEADSLGDDTAGFVTDAAVDLLYGVDPDRPLFLWVHYLDPHFPYQPPEDFAAADLGPACRRLMDDVAAGVLKMGHVEGDLGGRSTAALADCGALYDAEIAYTDLHVGRLLAVLRAAGRLSDYVVFTADHGENLGEDRLFYGHGPSVHDAAVRVPLLFVGPGVAAGVDDEAFRLEDVLPTLLGLLGGDGADVPATDGVDLSGRVTASGAVTAPPLARLEAGSALNVYYVERLFSGRAHSRSCVHADRWSLCAHPGREPHLYDHVADPFLLTDLSAAHPEARARLLQTARAWRPEAVRERAVRQLPHKLVERPLPAGGYARQLHDLQADPSEAVDVAAARPQVARRLGVALDAWDLPAPNARRAVDADAALRALGYID